MVGKGGVLCKGVTKPVCIVRQMTWAETNMTIAFETDGVAKRIQKQLAEVL